jgi:hypothetical protein
LGRTRGETVAGELAVVVAGIAEERSIEPARDTECSLRLRGKNFVNMFDNQ